jgi:N,N-dimethylformamidase
VPGGASGHETDKISPSSPTSVRLLARGLNPDGGGAEMAVHEPDGGGAVFASGSICWISSLLVDDAVSKITANVVRRYCGP